jgi:hypothetical protein
VYIYINVLYIQKWSVFIHINALHTKRSLRKIILRCLLFWYIHLPLPSKNYTQTRMGNFYRAIYRCVVNVWPWFVYRCYLGLFVSGFYHLRQIHRSCIDHVPVSHSDDSNISWASVSPGHQNRTKRGFKTIRVGLLFKLLKSCRRGHCLALEIGIIQPVEPHTYNILLSPKQTLPPIPHTLMVVNILCSFKSALVLLWTCNNSTNVRTWQWSNRMLPLSYMIERYVFLYQIAFTEIHKFHIRMISHDYTFCP